MSAYGHDVRFPWPRNLFDGWVVVGAVFVLFVVNAGLGFYGLSVFVDAITTEQGFTTTEVSFATSLFFVVSALAGRVVAPLIGRFDVRLIVGAGAIVAASGLWLIGRSTELAMLYVSYVVFAIGTGMSGLVAGTTLVTRWFHVKRSVALSVASTGLSVGGLTVTVLASSIIDRLGMADAAPWLSLLYLVLVAVALIGLWPDPKARGQHVDGLPPSNDGGQAQVDGAEYAPAVRSAFFRLVTLGFVITMGAQVGAIAQLFKFGTERADAGAALLSTIAFTSVVARLVGGVVATRISLIAMTVALAATQGISLWWLSQSNSRSMLIAAAVLFGCTMGNLLMLHPLVIADRFGVANYPQIFALSQLMVTGLGVAGGPYLLGWLRDVRSYTTSYVVASCLSAVGALIFFVAWRLQDRPDDPLASAATTALTPRAAGRGGRVSG